MIRQRQEDGNGNATISEAESLRLKDLALTRGLDHRGPLNRASEDWLRATVPDGWQLHRLKRLLSTPLKYGANEPAEHDDPEWVRYLRITDFGADGQLRDDTFRSLPPEVASEYMVQPGDVLLARSGATVGKSFIVPKDAPSSCFAGYLIRVRCDKRRLLPEYFYAFTRSSAFGNWKNSVATVATIQNIGADKYGELLVPLPPLSEQEKILEHLDRETAEIDAFIADQEELVALLQERRAAVICRAMTCGMDPGVTLSESGTSWWGAIPVHWRLDKLGRYFHVVLGKMLDGSREQRSGDLTLPYIRAANIQDSGLNLDDVNEMFFSPSEAAKLSILQGDLLVVEGGSIGTSFLVAEDMPGWSFQKTVNRVRPRTKASTAYLQYVLRHLRDGGVLAMMCAGSTIAHLTADKLQRLVIPVPPIDEQRQIVDFLDDETAEIDAAIADAREAIEVSKERRAALISAAVTGKIDVRNHDMMGSER